MSEIVKKLEESIENLKNKSARIYFFVQDTKGNAKASIRYIYQLALTLKENGHNVIILHEKPDYFGVQDWLGSVYMEKLEHISVEGQNLSISPEDTIIVPEILGYVMSQLNNLPCAKIVLCQSYDYIFETLQPGQTWSQFGFTKCITTSEKMKEYISGIMRNVSIDVIEPLISKVFEKSDYPSKPVIAVHSREHRDTINFIKLFYVKFPQYRWISFRDMMGVSEEQFANTLKECMLSVWIDDISSFGTFPLESMKLGVPVMGKVPKLLPSWLNENNGIWVQDIIRLPDLVADYIQNWLEDNISEKLYQNGYESSEKFLNENQFKESVNNLFNHYSELRIKIFESEFNKHQTVES